MAYRNKFDKTGESFALGANAEVGFVDAATKSGLKVTQGTKQDEFKHIDFFVDTDNGTRLSVEVKSRKKIKRGDKEVNDELLWIEFKNVAGKRGWLYGAADLIAFERETDFLMVNRMTLARLCEKLCDLTQINVQRPPLYTGYQRRDRNDLLSLIKISDIIDRIKYSVIKK
jgi:hypothetical protein